MADLIRSRCSASPTMMFGGDHSGDEACNARTAVSQVDWHKVALHVAHGRARTCSTSSIRSDDALLARPRCAQSRLAQRKRTRASAAM